MLAALAAMLFISVPLALERKDLMTNTPKSVDAESQSRIERFGGAAFSAGHRTWWLVVGGSLVVRGWWR
jgi:hypothetical protein